MAITYLADGGHGQGTTSPRTGVLPVGYTTGTLFIMQVVSREDSPTPVHGVTTSGVSWTQIGTTQFLDIGTTAIAQSMWYRFAASASETAPSISCPTPATLIDICTGFNGVDSTTPLDGVAPLGGTAAAAATLQPGGGTGITTATANAWVVNVVSTPDDNTLSLSTPNGFTNRYSGASYQSTLNDDYSLGMATQEKASAGNVTGPTWTQTTVGTDQWAWHLFVLRAAGGGGGSTPRWKDRHRRPRSNYNNLSYY